jgi:ribonuclease R
MVSANETVAEIAEKNDAPFLYRIHEQPSPEKASNFFSFLRDLGINAKGDTDDIKPFDFQNILNDVEDKPYSTVVNKVMLRSMQKARYSEKNKGHFGLASDCYCHFTSPIRRYPDLFVHRVLKEIIHGELPRTKNFYAGIAHDAAIDTSERERRADMAERDVDALYKVVYMSEHLGEEFDAVISGVTSNGIYAELPNTIEGIIRIESLPKDYYEYYEEKFMLKGINHSYRIGEAVKVQVASCDWGSMRVEFVLVDNNL